ncbi:MAG TPA: histidinol dehydrogenase, partial [Burkholderiaceae bacterium]|nr:histidinol dehydrogenase [Burkholderiaceae bacterium]
MKSSDLRRLSTTQADFRAQLEALAVFEEGANDQIESTVAEVLRRVKTEGDTALLDYTRRFDKLDVTSVAQLEVSQAQLQAALNEISPAERAALEAAADRIRRFHERQKATDWTYTEADGTVLGQRVTPLDRVGLYVPGGKAAYPSSLLMNAVPAKVAGVREVIMVAPT